MMPVMYGKANELREPDEDSVERSSTFTWYHPLAAHHRVLHPQRDVG